MDTISYDICHLQEVFINIKKFQKMEEYIKKLEIEISYLKKENSSIIKQFTCFGQDLVNFGELQINKEPYFCSKCKNVFEGYYIKHSEFIDEIVCLDCYNIKTYNTDISHNN